MRKIRVLVVDDSTVIRRLLSDSIASDPHIEVVGTAANGKIALAKIPQLNPDVVTLDIEMPEMDGLTTLVELRKLYPKLPVIMFSTLTERGAESTFEALSKGASDYVTKPANVGSVTTAMERVRGELVPKIKGFCPWFNEANSVVSGTTVTAPVGALNKRPVRVTARGTRIDVVAIGSSTGGPNALQAVIPQLPADFPVPVLIVQHMPPIFTKHLADRLDQLSNLSVVEARHGEQLHAGGVWIAPGDYHMTFHRIGVKTLIALNQGTPENSCRPSVDVMFRSVSTAFGSNVLSVVLTGMGQDGASGCEMIHSGGGRVIIQDQATSVVWGMPGAVARSGVADKTLPLSQIAAEIISQVNQGRVALRPTLMAGVQ